VLVVVQDLLRQRVNPQENYDDPFFDPLGRACEIRFAPSNPRASGILDFNSIAKIRVPKKSPLPMGEGHSEKRPIS
jgi:hypothetical protein